jgi:glucose-6-phosphate 1-epimerase
MHRIPAEKFSIHNHLEFSEEPAGFTRAALTHDSGASVGLFLYGAHITSWKISGNRELLFMSRKAAVEKGTPIRGGIPLIFPQFGPGPMIKHGFARINFWDVVDSGITDRREVLLKLRLVSSPEIYSLWPHQFVVELTITLGDSLTTSLRAVNDGELPFSFTAAFHTYFSVEDVRECSIEGLYGCEYIDSIHESRRSIEKKSRLCVTEMIDRIYVNTPRDLLLHDPKRGHCIAIKKVGFKDAVVWNPWLEGAQLLKDFGEMEYLSMLCVEAAHCESTITVAPGEFWVGVQVLHCIPV